MCRLLEISNISKFHCINAFVRACMCVCAYMRIDGYACVLVYMCVCTCISVRVCVYVRAYVFMSICACIYLVHSRLY